MQLNSSTASSQLIDQSGVPFLDILTPNYLSIRFEYKTLGLSFVIFRQEQMLPFVRVQLGGLSRKESNNDTTYLCQLPSEISHVSFCYVWALHPYLQ